FRRVLFRSADASPRPKPYRISGSATSQPGVSAPVTPATINTPTTSIARPSSTTPGGPSQAATYRAPAPETKAPSAIAASTQPAVITLNPKAFIKYSGSTNTIANSPTATAAAVKLPQVNVGSLDRKSTRLNSSHVS